MTEVVRGEASESEDEALSLEIKENRILASEVTGEASEESDEDVYDKSLRTSMSSISMDSLYKNNLLQRKLIETNLSICRSLNTFIKNLVTPASKQLLATDQMLIKSQLSMQAALGTLKQAEESTKQLYEKSDSIFTTNFIPNIIQLKKTT